MTEGSSANADKDSAESRASFAEHHRVAILFVTLALCACGVYAALHMPSSVFPETNFPRCVVLIDNGVMPANEMMATITRPIEEAVKDIPGVVQVRSATARGSAEVNVFFDWQTDMVQSELYVLSRLSQLKSDLPPTAKTTVWRLTFNAFPIMGVSLTSPKRDLTELWEMARYNVKPRLLRIAGVGRVDLVGGHLPEIHVVVDPLELAATQLTLSDVTTALANGNLVESAGFHSDNYTLYLTLVDSRAKDGSDVEDLVVAVRGDHPIRLRDIAKVEPGAEPVFNAVNAQGRRAVLLNVRAQPSGSDILAIATNLQRQLLELRKVLPSDVELSLYYDQSSFVHESVASVWESILIGLLFAVVILYVFLRRWGSVLTAIVVIPVSVLATLVVMFAANMTFNLMTLGGIAAAIGLIIDDAIVVVEAIYTRASQGQPRSHAIRSSLRAILRPLVGSTLTPVVVFIPLTFLDGLPGVFFRALALTMVVALLTSLVLAVTLTPALASLVLSAQKVPDGSPNHGGAGGFVLRRVTAAFERALRFLLRHKWIVGLACLAFVGGGISLYSRLASDFMPPMDEGGFVIDYHTPWGTSLEETDRMMREAETILQGIPEVEGYSRRTGARLALAIAEPNTGDFLVRLRADRARSTEQVKSDVRRRLNRALPGVEWEFPGILGDLIGDLTWSPKPIEVKLFSTDVDWLVQTAPKVKEAIESISGVVDAFDGLVRTGPTLTFRVRPADAARFGLAAEDIAAVVNTALLGRTPTSILKGDRVVDIRVRVDSRDVDQLDTLRALPIRTPRGDLIELGQVVDVSIDRGQLELHREDLRQLVAVTADLEGRDTGSAVAEIESKLSARADLPPGVVEFGGLFEQQQTAFENLMVVLFLGTALVFTVLLIEFRSFREPIAIVIGAVLPLFGTVFALWLTQTSLNTVSFLGAIIGVGIVAKNGILMLDLAGSMQSADDSSVDALAAACRRRLRPILMTSLATMLAMSPLALGIGHGADMLKPLAISIIGALSISVLISLLVTPTVYQLLRRVGRNRL